jgi:SAM-dependent methyltransferase
MPTTRLLTLLTEAGYTEAAVRSRLAASAPQPLPAVGDPVALARADELTGLLLLGRRTPATAIAPDLALELIRSGLVRRNSSDLLPKVRLTPFHELLLAGDLINEERTDVEADAVENPHRPTDVLSHAVPRERVRRALDIGTGNGVHALELAAHCTEVTAVDVSPRAIEFARHNARLNGVRNVVFQVADVVQGLPEHTFDLIVSNPPYLISPETAVVYRDGAGTGHVGTRILREAPRLLAADGLLVSLSSWAVRDERNPDEELRRIAVEAGCDALALVYATRTPMENALLWNGRVRDAEALHSVVRRWTGFYRAEGIKLLRYAIVALTPARRARPRLHVERVSLAGQQPDGGQLRDMLRAHGPGPAPDRLRPHPAHVLESTARLTASGAVVSEQLIRSTRGLTLAAPCGPLLIETLLGGPDDEARRRMLRRLRELALAVPESGP